MTAPTELDGHDERRPRTPQDSEGAEPPLDVESNSRAVTSVAREEQGSAPQGRPWHREPALWVSVAAVIVSVLALVLSQASSATDREFQERTRLTTVLQQLVDTQLATARAQSQAVGTGTIPPGSTAQVQFLVDEAYGLSQRVATTTYERLQIATTYQSVYDMDKALITARTAMQQARGPMEKMTAQRTVALILFNIGDVDGARLTLTQALAEAESGEPPLAPLIRTQVIFETEVLWTAAEVPLGNCAAGREHLDRARVALTAHPPGVAALVNPRLEQLAAVVAACRPPG